MAGNNSVAVTWDGLHRNGQKGFNLTELMVAVTIVAITASIALPAYHDQVRKGRRGDGTTLLMEISQLQERFYMENNGYTGDLSRLGYPGSGASVDSVEGFYRIQVENPDGCGIANCYRLSAVPAIEAQAPDGELRLWSDGTKERKVDGVWKRGWK